MVLSFDYLISASLTFSAFQDLWIGGIIKNGQWTWDETKEIIPIDTDSDFPPWLNKVTKSGWNCLSFDKYVKEFPLFIELQCNYARGYVCEINT